MRRIGVQAHNDDNHIWIGGLYELLYWNKVWTSLGEQMAMDSVLYYDDVPKNALLLLKNHNRGR